MMVTLDIVRKSNAAAAATAFEVGDTNSFTAVFAGGTSGIGEITLLKLAVTVSNPKIYIIGRNEDAAAKILEKLRRINEKGRYEFLRTDLALLRNVDTVCDQIKQKEKKINLLFLTQGALSFAGLTDNAEGIDDRVSLNYYSRAKMIHNLIPLLSAPGFGRVISVFRGGKEAKIAVDDLDLRENFSMMGINNHLTTMNTLILDRFSQLHPSVSFIPVYPGVVVVALKKGIFSSSSPWFSYGLNTLFKPFSSRPDEVAERMVFLSTSSRFSPAKQESDSAGVPCPDSLALAKGYDGELGSGMYPLNLDGETAGDMQLLKELRQEAEQKVWDYTHSVFERVEKLYQ